LPELPNGASHSRPWESIPAPAELVSPPATLRQAPRDGADDDPRANNGNANGFIDHNRLSPVSKTPRD
jgi:hypothetical protein